jgi:predicted XRE-type DNA-binding protein
VWCWNRQKTTVTRFQFEQSSGNVFTDLGLEDAEELYTRAALGAQVVTKLKERGSTQAEAAQLLGIKQPEVSALMCGRFHRFSQERLIGFLNNLDLKVTLHISRHQPGEPFQQVSVGP